MSGLRNTFTHSQHHPTMQNQESPNEPSIQYGVYLDEWYEQDLAQLKDGLLMQYMSQEETFDLVREGGRCFLYQALNLESDVPANSDKTLLHSFDSPDDFWNWLVRQPNWYLRFRPLHVDNIFARSLIYYINDLLKKRALDFDNEQHYQIYAWTEKVGREGTENALTQYCVRCGARVMYTPRYPRHICKDCVQLLTTQDGKPLDWGAVENSIQKSETRKVRVYIGKEVYWAEEARFGGTVVQK